MNHTRLSMTDLDRVSGGMRSVATCGASMVGGTFLGHASGGIPGSFRGVPNWVGTAGKVVGAIAGAALTYTRTDACK